MIRIIKADEHFHHVGEDGWLSTYWHFSFDFYRDPNNMGFGPLRVFNDDVIMPGKGFGFHPHRDMEIVTYVIEGELEHRDDKGNRGLIHAGEIQRMTAGTGIMHSEYNHSKEKPLRLLQMWIQPDTRGLEPSWEQLLQQQRQKQQQRFSNDEHHDNRFTPIVVPKGTSIDKALHIHQDASMYVSSLGAGRHIEYEIAQGRKAYVFVISGDGTVTIEGRQQQDRGEEEAVLPITEGEGRRKTKKEKEEKKNKMQKQDAARIEGECKISIMAEDNYYQYNDRRDDRMGSKPSELLLIDLPGRYNVNNNNRQQQ